MDREPRTRVAEALAEAERKLQVVIGETAMAGDYASSREVSGLAESIRCLAGQLSPGDQAGQSSAVNAGPIATGVSKNVGQPKQPRKDAKRTRSRERATENRLPRSDYPRFELRRGTLIRVGWSKKNKSEYEHKVPEAAFDQAVRLMSTMAEESGDGPLAADRLIEAAASVGEGVASYQIYVILGFLTSAGIVQKEGREGYRVPSDVVERSREYLATRSRADSATA